ncbi:MAG TPA: PfkB family carbohydrate kinase [Pseudonocardiaceae bacterium]|nr:PfkB family carbohydrate kinase [Pseudonocardiaceae bacterium]
MGHSEISETGEHVGAGGVLLVGLCTVDVVQRVTELPSPGAKVQSTSVELVAGGPAANASVTVAALGGRAQLVTVLGTHPMATLARDDLTAHGVLVRDTRPDRTEPPAVSAVAVREHDGERVVVSHNAAGVPTGPLPDWPALLAGVGALLVDGHHPELAVAAARAARGRRIPVVLDAGSDKPVLSTLLPLVDVCACSAAFRLGRAGARATERAVHDMGVPVMLRTAGNGPVRWSAMAAGRQVSGTVRPPAVAAKDTLGAGDVWHGALAHGVATLGHVPTAADLPGLVGLANHVAATRVATVGARAWLP